VDKERIKILLVEDDRVDRMAFERLVKREKLPYDYVTAGSVSEARAALTGEPVDLVLLDYLLGDGTAFDLFADIGDVPIVMLTGSGDEAIAIQAMKAGAHDYLTKDPEGNYLITLAMTVENAIHHWHDSKELERYRAHLEEMVKVRTAELSETYHRLLKEMTERKRAEASLAAYSERLEEMVEERTQALRDAQDKLIRQERLAALGKLAGGVGHDLRNPLGAIKNAAYFINMVLKEPEPEVKEALEILVGEVETSEAIIGSLLDFARAKPPVRDRVEINSLVHTVLSHASIPPSIQVVCQLEEGLPTVWADPKQLGRVFDNIILNAIQAMPDGGQLTARSSTPSAACITVSISDTGVGIPKQDLDSVFEPLFTTKAKGIGLGLALSKTFVEGHGGTIAVLSDGVPGKGCTFLVNLPIAEA
jgi:signal transduction histidine kinase